MYFGGFLMVTFWPSLHFITHTLVPTFPFRKSEGSTELVKYRIAAGIPILPFDPFLYIFKNFIVFEFFRLGYSMY